MATETTAEPKPAYVTYTTFDAFVSGLRESGIPNRIDRSVMDKLSGSNQSFLMGALRFLGLITDVGEPTQNLKDLIEGGDPKKALAKILHSSYAFLFSQDFNLKAATESQVTEKFREKGLSGDTIRKAISFFTLACDACGVTYSPHLKGKRGGGGRSNGVRKARKPKTDTPGGENSFTPAPDKSDPLYHAPHVLPLAKDRKVTVIAPKDMTSQEIDRLSMWLSVTFQLDWSKNEK